MQVGTLKEVIETVVKNRFPDADIISVDVLEDEGSEGERVLRVTVVFETTSQSQLLDPHRAAGIVRHMRPKLRAIGEDAFPILSFISKADAEMAHAGA